MANSVTVVLTQEELIIIRYALNEWRTVAPAHIAENPGRLVRWLEERDLFDSDRMKLEVRVAQLVSDMVTI